MNLTEDQITLISLLKYISKWKGITIVCKDGNLKIGTDCLRQDLNDMSKMVEQLLINLGSPKYGLEERK